MTDTTDTPTGQALARVDNSPRQLVQRYEASFAAVLPSHITRPETWIRVAQGALKKGKRHSSGKGTELEVAAANNPAVFLSTLLDAARLGLEPGTEQYYLTPREVKGRGLEILGIVGYQGHIELMYRAGAASSVIAEVVYTRDAFTYAPGRHLVPDHEIDWDAEDRGDLRLAYAYARLKDGGTSRVPVLNKAAIARIKKSSRGSDTKYSPWVNHTEAMWLKSAVRQLSKWVPTSAEFRTEQLRTSSAADEQRDLLDLPVPPAESEFPDDDEVADAEFVDGDGTYEPDDPARPM